MFYARIFEHHHSKTLRWNLWTLGVLVVVNSLVCILVATFQCHPIHRYWKVLGPGSCINIVIWQILHACTNLIFDMWILALPMPILARLHASKRRRALIITIFTLGYGFVQTDLSAFVMNLLIGHSVTLVSLVALILIAIAGNGFLSDYTCKSSG